MRSRRITDIVLIIAVIIYAESLFGPVRPMIVMSRSMEPVLRTGTIIIGRKVDDKTTLQVGDVCTYKPYEESYTVTHRIEGISPDGYVFKGDNNKTCDPAQVVRDQILYRIIYPDI